MDKIRVQSVNEKKPRKGGEYVLYWMTAYRRLKWNYTLDRALHWCEEFGLPLLIFEALRCDYPWASPRIHNFVIDGMEENWATCQEENVAYFPYLEDEIGAGKGLLEALAEKAALVVTDDYPCFFLPSMMEVAGKKVTVKMEKVDSNGLLPFRRAEKAYSRAYLFRKFLHRQLANHWEDPPEENPLDKEVLQGGEIPGEIARKWPAAEKHWKKREDFLSTLPLDQSVKALSLQGGRREARARWKNFLQRGLENYDEESRHPDKKATSGLSPYLHFGCISTHELFDNLVKMKEWNLEDIRPDKEGKNRGWWGMGADCEAFLDQLITWRELGFNGCWQEGDYDQYDSLPDWAQKTLSEHEEDPREYTYSLEEFERAETHSQIWNAAQTQLLREGVIHNYLRMVWGKKILEWTPSPQKALEIMIELNNKYALDGRDPNSYSGILWVLGKYDRAWGPERAIYGKVRYMSLENTERKLKMKNYLKTYSPLSKEEDFD